MHGYHIVRLICFSASTKADVSRYEMHLGTVNYMWRLLQVNCSSRSTTTQQRQVLIQRSIQSSGLLKALYTLLPRQTCSITHQPYAIQLMREGCSDTYPPLSIARYSFIKLGELEQYRVKNLPKVLHRSTELEPGSS